MTVLSNGLTIDELLDLLNDVREHFPDKQYELAQNLQNHPILEWYMTPGFARKGGGKSLGGIIVVGSSGNARYTTPYARHSINVTDITAKFSADWVHAMTEWSVDTFEIEAMLSQPSEVLADLLDQRRTEAYEELFDIVEQRHWVCPEYNGDPYSPLGIPYWIGMALDNVNSATPSFNGYLVRFRDGTTSNVVGGIDASSAKNVRWRNLTVQYVQINEAAVQSMKSMMRLLNFVPPSIPGGTKATNMSGPNFNPPDYVIYSGGTPYEQMETYMQAHFDQFRADLDGPGPSFTFRRVPWRWVASLDDADYNPVYLTNKRKFRPMILSRAGRLFIEGKPMTDRDQHTVATTHVDGRHQLLCTNKRQAGGVMHNVIT